MQTFAAMPLLYDPHHPGIRQSELIGQPGSVTYLR
jgi:hypothetical protein